MKRLQSSDVLKCSSVYKSLRNKVDQNQNQIKITRVQINNALREQLHLSPKNETKTQHFDKKESYISKYLMMSKVLFH